ncbi:hypothetical protein U0070_005654 [Myodes glareolus]|uniref:Ubinuclein 1 n=1 Tax=Myodes glareolus TaxID=447135 RepID=A0AAW0IMF0_MYOGA
MRGEGKQTGWLLGPVQPLTPLLGSLGKASTSLSSTASHVKSPLPQARMTLPYPQSPSLTSSSSSACPMASPLPLLQSLHPGGPGPASVLLGLIHPSLTCSKLNKPSTNRISSSMEGRPLNNKL